MYLVWMHIFTIWLGKIKNIKRSNKVIKKKCRRKGEKEMTDKDKERIRKMMTTNMMIHLSRKLLIWTPNDDWRYDKKYKELLFIVLFFLEFIKIVFSLRNLVLLVVFLIFPGNLYVEMEDILFKYCSVLQLLD